MQIVKNSMIYLGSSLLSKMMPFLLLPIMTHYLSAKEYGILSIYTLIITLYSALIGMAINTNVSKNFFIFSKEELALLIGNIFYILFFTFIFYFGITLIVALSFETLFSIPAEWLLIVPLISVMMMVNELNTTILRNEQRAYLFGVFEVSNMMIKVGVTVLFLIVFSMGWYSQAIGMFAGSMIFFIVGVFYIKKRRYLTLQFDRAKIKSILHISLPLIPHVLGSVVIAVSDRLFIEKMVSLEAVGMYSVGYMFGMVVMLFTDAFIKAWSPWFYKNLSEPTDSKKRKIVLYTYIYIVFVFVLAVGISLISELFLPYVVDEKFYGASDYILWISLGYAVFGVYKIFFPYLVHISRTSFLAISTVCAAVINLALNYILIRKFGAIGAAYATIFSFAISALLVFWYQRKNYYMPWRLHGKR